MDDICYEHCSTVIDDIKCLVKSICFINPRLYGQIRAKINIVLEEMYETIDAMTAEEKCDYNGFNVISYISKQFTTETALYSDIQELIANIWNDENATAIGYIGATGWSAGEIMRQLDKHYAQERKRVLIARKSADALGAVIPPRAINCICQFLVEPEKRVHYRVEITEEYRLRMAREERIAQQFAAMATAFVEIETI